MNNEVIINESFEDFAIESITRIDEFDTAEVAALKIKIIEMISDNTLNEIISYPKIKKNLIYDLPHQKEGALRILRDFNGSALLADEVGLGKTITAGIVIRELIERGFAKKILILTPPSLVDQWVMELEEKFELNFTIIESEEDWHDAPHAIASIDRVKIYDDENRDFKHRVAHDISWDLLIVDEAHKLKDRRSMRTRFVDRIQKKRFLILTATPFQNDLLELYSLLNLLKKGHLGTLQNFKKNFLSRGNKRKPLNHEELRRKLREVMVRRKRSETTVSYMRRIPRTIQVELSPHEKLIYDEIQHMIKSNYFLSNGMQINGKLAIYALLPKITSSSKSAIETLQRIVVSEDRYHERTRIHAGQILQEYEKLEKDSKIETLIQLIKEIFYGESGQKVLIYTKHPTTLHYIADQLSPLGLCIVTFTGANTREEKTKIIETFRNAADIMLSTETGCEGLNFQFCNNLINYDLPWNPMSVEQRIGRIDRIGQKKDMNIFSLATKDTMEEYVVDLIINKMCCVGLIIGELPIILFNLGLDGNGELGINKIEEMIMNHFIDAKNNLEIFSKGIKEIEKIIAEGITAYNQSKDNTSAVIDAP